MPILQNTAYAACDSDFGGAVEDYTMVWSTCSYTPNLTPTESFEVVTGSTTPTASLSIDGKASVEDKINSSYGTTNYASHTVSVNVTGAASYDLILSGPAKLSGPSTINATSGATGANLANDTWGYAWENTSVIDSNASYKALGSSVKLTGDALNSQSASFSKKLAFAAKFSDKSDAGIYHADVSLSLVATPKVTTVTANAVPWDKLVYMQDMTEYACMQAKVGDSKTLKDIRDNSSYTIAKLSDGKCWMTQNLRLSRETLKSNLTYLTSLDTNTLSNHYYLPASTTGAFSNTKNSNGFYTNAQVRAAASGQTGKIYGAYYSYNVATVNSTTSQSSGTATQDICPKGWKLPTQQEDGFFNLLHTRGYDNGLKVGNFASDSLDSGYWLGGAIDATDAAFFPAAGYITSSVFSGAAYGGHYWTSSILTTTNATYLGFSATSNGASLSNSVNRYQGHSIRCIAK